MPLNTIWSPGLGHAIRYHMESRAVKRLGGCGSATASLYNYDCLPN